MRDCEEECNFWLDFAAALPLGLGVGPHSEPEWDPVNLDSLWNLTTGSTATEGSLSCRGELVGRVWLFLWLVGVVCLLGDCLPGERFGVEAPDSSRAMLQHNT